MRRAGHLAPVEGQVPSTSGRLTRLGQQSQAQPRSARRPGIQERGQVDAERAGAGDVGDLGCDSAVRRWWLVGGAARPVGERRGHEAGHRLGTGCVLGPGGGVAGHRQGHGPCRRGGAGGQGGEVGVDVCPLRLRTGEGADVQSVGGVDRRPRPRLAAHGGAARRRRHGRVPRLGGVGDGHLVAGGVGGAAPQRHDPAEPDQHDQQGPTEAAGHLRAPAGRRERSRPAAIAPERSIPSTRPPR